MLDDLTIAVSDWQRRSPASRNLKKLRSAVFDLRRSIVEAAILDEDIWTNSATAPESLTSHVKMLQRLVASRQPGQPNPWVFTTNYDLAIEWAAETAEIQYHTGFVGVHNRSFTPQSFDLGIVNRRAKGEARFGCMDFYLVKLHGSLSWYRTPGGVRELSCYEAWPKVSGIIRATDDPEDSIVVFPSATKFVQTIGYLYGELFRRFSEFLMQPQTALIVAGYSFSDEHLNSDPAVRSRVELFPFEIDRVVRK